MKEFLSVAEDTTVHRSIGKEALDKKTLVLSFNIVLRCFLIFFLLPKPIKFGNQASEKSTTLIDWSSTPMQIFLAGIGSLLALLMISGFLLQRHLKKKEEAEKNGKDSTSLVFAV